MPGPKMGPRPDDFDEELIRKAPTFQKWLKLQTGEKLTYACREFIKGGVEDEERLMRRIMIARRNNLKDHAILKWARAAEAEKRGVIPGQDLGKKGKNKKKSDDNLNEQESLVDEGNSMNVVVLQQLRPPSPSNPSGTKRRRVAGVLQPTDEEILMEMDVPAVEATRSYRKWLALPDGTSFTYNQKYIKGKDDHDWLLKKNIWRRMRYRRENQVKVKVMKREDGEGNWTNRKAGMMSHDNTFKGDEVDIGLNEEEGEGVLVSRAVVDAAAAAAVKVEAFEPGIDADAVAALGADDPIVSSALDAAAQLAAAAVGHVSTDAGLEESTVAVPHPNGNA